MTHPPQINHTSTDLHAKPIDLQTKPIDLHAKRIDLHAKCIDLHVHSTRSDGTLSPAELVDYALEKGLSAIALTDHDTTDGIAEALEAAKGRNMTVIPGIEFSAEWEGKDIHILGLFIDDTNAFFKEQLEKFIDGRIRRNLEMCEKLQSAGIDITYDKLTAEFPNGVITRSHYAAYLLNHGYVQNYKEAFQRFVGDESPFFVPRRKITPFRAVEIILKAGGLPILAHPILYHLPNAKLDRLVRELSLSGLAGIEAVYSSYHPAEERQIRQLASKYQLAISGGSDFHGKAKPGLDMGSGYGHLFIPESILDNLKQELSLRQAAPEKGIPRKILFTDLDGTLLDDQKQISSYTREILDAWCLAGHRLVLSSGRDILSVAAVKEELGLDYPGMILIGYNGGLIYDCDQKEILYQVPLAKEDVILILKTAKEQNVYCQVYTDTHILSPGRCEELDYYTKIIKTPVLFAEDMIAGLPDNICKCLAIELKERKKLEHFRDALLPCGEGKFIPMFSSRYYLEFFSAAAGKGAALEKLCALLSIPKVLSIAIGDQENDVSMLKAAGFSIAMCNGVAAAKEAATVLSDFDNNHDGFARTLAALL